KSRRFLLKGDARSDRHSSLREKLFFVLLKIIRNFICKHGKNAKVVKTKVLQVHSTGPGNSTTTTAITTAAQPPQNDLLIRSLNVAAELFTVGAEAVALQGEAEEQLQEQQLRHQQKQDGLNKEIICLTREIQSVEA